MMDDDKLNVLKTEVISILASCSSPLTVSKFLREYKEVIGRNFPWAQNGFRSPTEFLKSMSDILSFRNNESGEVLVPVENNSGHITKLVREQKKNSKKSSSMRRPRPVQLPRDSQESYFKSLMQLEVQNPLTVRGWERCQPISSLLNAPTYNPAAPNIAYASSHYSQFSHNLCNIDQIPQSLVLNTISTLQTEFTSTKLPLISKKVSKNEMQHSSELAITDSSILGITNGIKEDIGRKEISPGEDELKNNSSSENQNLVEGDSNSKVSEISSSLDIGVEDNCPISEKMKENFRKILSKHKGGLLVSKLASAYFKMFNVPLNCQDYGLPTIKDLVMSCQDVFKIQQKKHAKDWLLFDVNNESDDSTRWIPIQVLENMQELSLAYPKGISSNDILKIYKNVFRADLDIAKLGFDSLSSFLVNCQSIECCTDDDQYVVFPVKWGQKDKEPEESMTDPFLSVDTYSIFSKKYFQDNVCGYQFHYKKFIIPKETTTIKVLVADCISPDCLWLQTLHSAESLNELMYELNNLYDEEEQYYLMDENVICPGLACCVKFNNKQWHRALIEEVYTNSVKVSYVDYGTSSVVSFNNLRTLDKKFSEASIHSFRSRIHNVKPVNNKSWTEECLEFFFDTILDYILVAEIVEIKAEIASVILVDTKGSEDHVINFMLVENGFALHVIDSYNTNISESNCLNNAEETRNNTPEKTEKTFPDCFLDLLPYWLHYGRSWSDVTNIFEESKLAVRVAPTIKKMNSFRTHSSLMQRILCNINFTLGASHVFFNDSSDENQTGVSNYLTSTECVQNRVLSLFMKQPKVVCDAWKKTFYSLIDEFEKRFFESIEIEFLKSSRPIGNGSTHINNNFSNIEASSNLEKYFDKLKINHPKKFDGPVSIKCEKNVSGENENTDQYSYPYRMPVSKKEDYLNKNCNSNSSPNDLGSPMSISKESKKPKVIPAKMFNLVIHLIRYNSEIYILIDELLTKFAKSVPSMLVKHRLCQHQINITPFIVTPEHNLYDELNRLRLNLKNDAFSLVPLSLSSDIILAVEPSNTRVAKVLRELSDECYTSEEFWNA